MVSRRVPTKGIIERRVSTKDKMQAYVDRRSVEARESLAPKGSPDHKLAYMMAAAYVAGERSGDYRYWIAHERISPAIAEGAIQRMKFVLDEVRGNRALRKAVINYLTRLPSPWVA